MSKSTFISSKNLSKEIGILFAICIIVVFGYKYNQFVVARDYFLDSVTSCNPELESCFAADCSLVEGECDDSPYKKINIHASVAPHCLEENDCEDFSCSDIDGFCEEKFCTEDILEEGEMCVTPLNTLQN